MAIELAAARADLVPPELLLARLDKRLALLGSGPPTAPSRHQTLNACIGWSVDQLPEPVHQLFALMSVFGGSVALDSIEEISGQLLPDLDVLTGLDTLVRNNLVRAQGTTTGPRLSMLETIREFAREELDAIGLSDRAATAHADHYLRVFTRDSSTLFWPPRTLVEFLEWTADMSNARLAMARLQDTGRWSDVAEPPSRCGTCGWPAASTTRLSSSLPRAGDAGHPPPRAGPGLVALSIHENRAGHHTRADECLRDALLLCKTEPDAQTETQAMLVMAMASDRRGETSKALEWERRARSRAQDAQDEELLE